MKRRRMSRRASRSKFRRTSGSRRKNYRSPVSRGGIRL